MPLGTGELKRQMAGRGAFAVVSLHVERTEKPVALTVSPEAKLTEGEFYLPAVQVGIEHVWARSLTGRDELPHFKVDVRQIKTTAVDTSVMMVVYATILAVCDALDLDPKQFAELDVQNRRLSLVL